MAPTIIKSVVTPTKGYFADGSIYDLVDLGTLKSVLQIDNGSDDVYLKMVNSQAANTIRRHCNRTFQVQTYQDQFWAFRDPYPWQLPGGVMPLQLQRWPISGDPCLSQTAAPIASGTLSAFAGGSLQSENYFVRVTYQTPYGESPVSPEVNLVVAAGNLLEVAPPQADPNAVATGWNVYVGTSAGAETKQNGAALGLGSSWQMTATGVQPGAALPSFISVTLNANVNNSNISLIPQNLIEGEDFIADYEVGQLSRLFPDGYPCQWEMLPLQIIYRAGFKVIPPEIQDACIRLVRAAYFARTRDPLLMSRSIPGSYEARWWVQNPNESAGNLPRDVLGLLSDYRVPVMG